MHKHFHANVVVAYHSQKVVAIFRSHFGAQQFRISVYKKVLLKFNSILGTC